MTITGVHHIAYRCNDAQETVDFYTGLLGMDYAMAISEERVPSTHEYSPYMHIFFEAGNSYLAFFEIPESPPMQKDPNTPDWVQHIAIEVDGVDSLTAYKERIEAHGLAVVGPTDHEFIRSIYFFDPSGHRVELTVNTTTPQMAKKLRQVAPAMLAEWNKSKKAVKHAAWLHEREFAK